VVRTGRDTGAAIAQPDGQQGGLRRRGRAEGRPPAFEPERYRRRTTVERRVGRLKQHRAVAIRYDRRDCTFHGTRGTAAIVIRLRDIAKGPSDRP
ncbi:IS5/IS1182 family transposase, partial [Streptomyces uncialis]